MFGWNNISERQCAPKSFVAKHNLTNTASRARFIATLQSQLGTKYLIGFPNVQRTMFHWGFCGFASEPAVLFAQTMTS